MIGLRPCLVHPKTSYALLLQEHYFVLRTAAVSYACSHLPHGSEKASRGPDWLFQGERDARSLGRVFSSRNFLVLANILFLFLFDNYCLTVD